MNHLLFLSKKNLQSAKAVCVSFVVGYHHTKINAFGQICYRDCDLTLVSRRDVLGLNVAAMVCLLFQIMIVNVES